MNGAIISRHILLSSAAAASLLVCGSAASAQATAAAGADAGADIVVTARREAESLQNVPLSVQVLGGEMLDKASIRDFTEITNRVPGAKLNTSNATDPEIFMRGIGTDIQGAGADGSIGFFLDGVYLSRATGTLIDIFDLERVEVLKGPQSLRFGKNVVGGLIHYITRKPSFDTEARIEAGYGRYNEVNGGASVSGAISDTVAGRITISTRNHDGYAVNTLGGDEEDVSVQALRGALLFRPSDNLDLTISGDYTRRRDGARWVDIVDAGTSNAVTFNRFFAPPIPGLPANFSLPARNLPFKNDDPRRGSRNFTGFQNSNLYGVAADLDWRISDSLSLSSITAYRSTSIKAREDGCGIFWNFPIDQNGVPIITSALQAVDAQRSVFPYLNTVPDCWFDNRKTDKVKAFSQELRVSFDNEGPLKAAAGIYYLNENIDRAEIVPFLFPDFDAITNIAFALAFGGPPDPPAGGISNSVTSAKAQNYGVFGEFTYDITEALSLNAGVRYAKDRKRFRVNRFGQSFDEPVPPGGFIATDRRSWDAWLPSATLSFQPTDTVNIFARIERGYKAGGWTGEGAGGPQDAIISFEPEFALTHELGGKFLLANRAVRLNLTGFLTKYDDLQTQQFLQLTPNRPPDNFVVNAANGTEAYGVEVDVSARLGRLVSLFGNYAYTRCTFTGELFISEGVDIDGNTCRRTPKHAFNVGGELAGPVTDELTASVGADLQFTSPYFFDNTNDPRTRNPSEHTLNARASIGNDDAGWRLSVWAKNLTGELNFADKLELFGTIYGNYQPPRTYGVTFSWTMGR
jgi:iron complex outermembrane recepter protein